MNSAVLPHDHFMPQPLAGRGTGFLLALLAHGLLVLALVLGMNWQQTHRTVSVEAELWAAIPRAAAPEAAAPPVTKKSQPVPDRPESRKPAPTKSSEDAQIATAKSKKEKALEDEREQKEIQQKKAKAEAEKEAQKLQAQRKEQEQKKEQQEQERMAAAREAQLKRIQNLAASGSGAQSSTGDAAQSSGPSADYLSRVAAQIKPRIINPSVSGNPSVVFEIFLAPDGRIVGQRLMSPSGVVAWDSAVERGIIDTKILPRLPNGTAPKSIILSVRPGD